MRIVDHRLCHNSGEPYPFVESPNVGGKMTPEYLVMHHTTSRSAEESIKLLTDPKAKASAHVLIGRDGSITQLVPFDRVAWHAGQSSWQGRTGLNKYSIGIELDNVGPLTRKDDKWMTWFGREYDGEDVLEVVHKHETSPTGWQMYTPEQIDAAEELATLLVREYGLRDVVGHEDIAPGRKRDPGPAFPMAEFRAAVLTRGAAELPRRNPAAEEGPLPDTPPVVAPVLTIAGFKSDESRGEDLLDIATEVETLCSVLIARDVDPPVSLGLFGDWGSGKSFFMHQMRQQITRITEEARKARGPTSYCKNVVQLEFNAWHYIDTNLWASLVSEIFEGLARAVVSDRNLAPDDMDPEEARVRLLAATTSSKDAVAELERDMKTARAELSDGEQLLARLQQSEWEVVKRLSPRAILHEALRITVDTQVEARETVDEAMAALKIPEAKARTSEAKAQLLELRGIGGYLRALYLRMQNEKESPLWLLSIALFFIIVLLGGLVIRYVDLEGWGAVIAGVASIVASAAAFLAPFFPHARRAMQRIEATRTAWQPVIAGAQEEKTKELTALQEKRHAQIEDLRRQLEEQQQKIQLYERQLDMLRADRQMATFIRERQQSADYAQHLGVIARARHDFHRLSVLLGKVRDQMVSEEAAALQRQASGEPAPNQPTAAPATEEEKLRLPPIDRIILYIDDLDRCPERKVIDVLQAVHLLLAFPLFVVVVGVDSRWLLHSLRQHSRVFRQSLAAMPEMPEEEKTHWQSTPLNYLEKIFQIPFNLRPMGEAGFGNLIDDLAKNRDGSGREAVARTAADVSPRPTRNAEEEVEEPTDEPPEGEPRERPADATDEMATGSPVDPEPDPREDTASVVDLNPAHLRIEAWERAYMKQLHPLIPSPRAAKRFVNVYRLIRTKAYRTGENEAFVGDETQGGYRRVLLLLAIQVGYPAEGTEILRDLLEGDHPETWGLLIEWYRRRTAARPVPSAVPGAVDPPAANGDGASETPVMEAERWRQLLAKLEKLRRLMADDPPCSEFRDAAREVARYSFISGRVLHTQRSGQPAADGEPETLALPEVPR